MSNFDASISSLIYHLRALADEMSAENADPQAAHVLNAILDLRKAYSSGYRAELDRQDRERLEALRNA